MSEATLREKLVCITQSSLGQQILDREFWQKLEKPLGWRLSSFTGRQSAEFFTGQTSEGLWAGLSVVTPPMRDSILVALGQGEVVRAEREQAQRQQLTQAVEIPLAPVVPFPRSR